MLSTTREPILHSSIASSTGPKLFLLVLVFGLLLRVNHAGDQVQESGILLEFKRSISDPLGHLGEWSGGSTNHCSWSGVSCDSSLSVTGLDLQSRNLSGAFDSIICNLPSLISITLSDNNFTQLITDEFHKCRRLAFLDLSYNSISGELPENITSLASLEYLDLEYNAFTGPMPDSIGNLSELQVFSIWSCFFTTISPALGRLTKLTNLSLSYNPFTTGLPQELRHLKKLQSLKCGGCRLTGSIPEWIGELQALDFLELTYNSLSGTLPVSLMSLPKLTSLELYNNMLTGPIPREIENLVSLTDLDLNSNFLNGSIPTTIANIANLSLIHLWNNSLTGEIPPGLSSLGKLHDVALFQNRLTGSIPSELGMHSSFEIFDVSTNLLTGAVPGGLCTGGRLLKLILFNNSLTGELPQAYGNCTSLIRVRIADNKLSGELPSGLWGLPLMRIMELYDNSFKGAVPPMVGGASSLQTLRIHNNRFAGPLPVELGKLQELDEFSASGNMISGSIPGELCKCYSLSKLLLGSNNLRGDIPRGIGELTKLVSLDLSNNQLSGNIPASMSGLVSLNSLDLSRNRLTGRIPRELQSLRLGDFLLFNVSYNDLSGPLLPGMDSSVFSFAGNPKLCSESSLRSSITCREDSDSSGFTGRKKPDPGLMAWVAGAVLASAAAASALCSWYLYRRCHRTSEDDEKSPRELPWVMTPFQKLAFTVDDILNSLDEDCVIGSGGAGKVYRATLDHIGTHLAVKKLWDDSSKLEHSSGNMRRRMNDYGFQTEVDILGRIRHLNIVRLLCCCSNGRTNLLVYDYVPNGSLGDVLHSTNQKISGALDWPTRYKIALGAAQGLSYLHHDCTPQILHRDIKSNNILLSDSYEALLADFGLAKLVGSGSSDGFSMSLLAGSHGYIAPEYAHGMKVNAKSDVYSFGVVLLELVTGRRPVGGSEFGEHGVDIVTWVCRSVQSKQGVSSVIDPRIPDSTFQRDVLLVLKIALRCTNALPTARPSMREVVQMLLEAEPGVTSPTKSKPEL